MYIEITQTATFLCKARIDDVRTRKGWNFPSCGGDKCKKGATRKHGRFWCDSCDTAVEYPVIKYCHNSRIYNIYLCLINKVYYTNTYSLNIRFVGIA